MDWLSFFSEIWHLITTRFEVCWVGLNVELKGLIFVFAITYTPRRKCSRVPDRREMYIFITDNHRLSSDLEQFNELPYLFHIWDFVLSTLVYIDAQFCFEIVKHPIKAHTGTWITVYKSFNKLCNEPTVSPLPDVTSAYLPAEEAARTRSRREQLTFGMRTPWHIFQHCIGNNRRQMTATIQL